jgi:CheY-like chemotaxis protein
VPAIDPGEAKHAPLDRKMPAEAAENSISIKQAEQPSAAAQADYAHRYLINSKVDASDLRRKIEDRVRRSKRAGSECPFKDADGQCSMLFIRCGDRLQFSMRESGSERRFFHRCTYDWRRRGDHVLIVDDDASTRDFCKSSFSLFMNYSPDMIATAGSVDAAIDMLSRSKIDGKKFGLVISDIIMPGRSGYDLVNELYSRNFDLEIVLMKEERETLDLPSGYRGGEEVLPNQSFVSGILIKPFHSDKLMLEVKNLRFGWEHNR